ncbi:membrane protein required for beta-lactamase induction [Phyllobacterium ifriqiyense]|uniref:Membrane protein required for beta-lactamase induction n=1 Tax=Phyllobacterium ifriqiyense TaxID=314238 RepID=A0ABU0S7Y9_9HYPH|nr:membrane protein required for beta-lactamase induction [Phyllobacterium ifriqiyense]
MNFLLGILSVAQILMAALIALFAVSAIHQILAAILFGFGVLTAALVVLIVAVERPQRS